MLAYASLMLIKTDVVYCLFFIDKNVLTIDCHDIISRALDNTTRPTCMDAIKYRNVNIPQGSIYYLLHVHKREENID